MPAKFVVAVGVVAIQAAFLALLGPGEAVARPGTPTGVVMWQCEPRSGWQYDFDMAPPSMCVAFEDTATQPVRFEFEITVNGQRAPLSAFYAGCYRRHTGAGGETCHSLESYSVSDWNRDQAFYLGTEIGCWDRDRGVAGTAPSAECRQLAFDTEYCIRIRTRDEDGYVSEIWSHWACARTRPRPQPPSQPYVEVSTSRRGDQVTVSWGGGGDDVGEYDLDARTSRTPDQVSELSLYPHSVPRGFWSQPGRFTIDIPWAAAMDMEGEAYLYRVCAINISGRACSEWVSSLGDEMPRSMRNTTFEERDTSISSVPLPPAIDRTGAILQEERFEGLDAVGEQLSQRRVTASAGLRVTPERQRPSSCIDGYTWRMARSPDPVCVTMQSHELAQSENATAPSRIDPNGAWGPASCLSGYVWREAFDGDTVCVTPPRREQVREENRQAPNFQAP